MTVMNPEETTSTPTTPAAWTPDATLGPRQAAMFNKAIRDYGWKASMIREITDHGEHNVVRLGQGVKNPATDALLCEIQATHGNVVTAANYMKLVAALGVATRKLQDTQPIEDRRTTPEQRAERARIIAESQEKERAKAAHLATLTHHNYTLAETSAAVKRVLMTLFPNTTFSVRSESYSGGSSITAGWTDGPTERQVRPVLDVFSRAYFDGMEDLEHHIAAPEWNGHLFDFTGKYLSGSRNCSAVFLRECADRFATETGLPAPAVVENGRYSHLPNTNVPCGWKFFPPDRDDPAGVGTLATDSTGHDTADHVVNQIAHLTSKEQPTIPYNIEHWHDEENPDAAVRTVVFRILLGEVKPAAGATSVPITSTDGVTISENTEKNGIEIRFAIKPDAAVLANLKANGWRWSRFSSCWWHKQTAEAADFAQSIATKNV